MTFLVSRSQEKMWKGLIYIGGGDVCVCMCVCVREGGGGYRQTNKTKCGNSPHTSVLHKSHEVRKVCIGL